MRKTKKLIGALLIALTVVGLFGGVSASADNSIAYGAATVDATLLNIRKTPELLSDGSNIISTIGNNTIVVILRVENDEWFYINYNGTKGYAAREYFKDVLAAENFSATGTLTATDVRVRVKPATSEEIIATYEIGKTMSVIGINNGWYKVKVDGNTGYVRSDLMEITSGFSVGGTSSAPVNTSGNKLVDFALNYVGYKYKYGGKSPSSGFDCSGFTTYVFSEFGVSLSRSSSQQYKNNGVSVSKSELQPGDLLFFSNSGTSGVGHVGIYIGDSEFVHASGTNVGVVVSRIDSTYYTRHWIGAKRVAID